MPREADLWAAADSGELGWYVDTQPANSRSQSASEESHEQAAIVSAISQSAGKGKAQLKHSARKRRGVAAPPRSARSREPSACASLQPTAPPAALPSLPPLAMSPELVPPPLLAPSPMVARGAIAPDFEVGLFWDYENISLARGMDGAETSNRLREVCLRHGRLVERRVYHDPEKVNSVQHENRSALDTAGFTLVDCPARNLKETIDKKIIVDVMHFALTRVARQQPACIVLLTNDGDYAYMLSRLRDLQVRCIVIYTEGHAAAALLTACDLALTWKADVLQLESSGEGALAMPPPTPRNLAAHEADVQRKAERRTARASTHVARRRPSWSASVHLRGLHGGWKVPSKQASSIARRQRPKKLPPKMVPRRQAKRSDEANSWWTASEQLRPDTQAISSAARHGQGRQSSNLRHGVDSRASDGFEFDEWEDDPDGWWTERRGKKRGVGRGASTKRESKQRLAAKGKAIRKAKKNKKGAKKGKGGKTARGGGKAKGKR